MRVHRMRFSQAVNTILINKKKKKKSAEQTSSEI